MLILPTMSPPPSDTPPPSDAASRFAILRSVESLADLPRDWIAQLASQSQVVTSRRGATIYREGEEPDALRVIADGRVVLVREPLGRPTVRLASLGSGDLLGGEIWTGTARTSTARVIAAGHVLRIERKPLFELGTRIPDLAMRLQLAAARQSTLRMAGALDAADKRVRYRTELDVTIRHQQGDVPAKLLDVSQHGLRLDPTPESWEPDARVRFDLDTPVGILPVLGRVVWREARAVGLALERAWEGLAEQRTFWALLNSVRQST